MTYVSTADRIAEYKRIARRERRRSKRSAENAAEWYALARSHRGTATWLTRRSELWTPEFQPAQFELLANTYVRLADLYVRSSFHEYGQSRFYFQLARDYERRA